MKESILDVLLYLFEHYFVEDAALARDRDSLSSGPLFKELAQAGFTPAEINKAFDWLDALAAQHQAQAVNMQPEKLAENQVRIRHLIALRDALVAQTGSTGFVF